MQNSISYSRSLDPSEEERNYTRYWESMLHIAYKRLPSTWYQSDLHVALSFLPYRKSIMLIVPKVQPYLLLVRREVIALLGTPFNSRHQGHLSYLDREIIIVSEGTAYQSILGFHGDIFNLECPDYYVS